MRIAGSSRRWEWRGQRLAVARVAAIAYREVAPAAFVMSCSTSSGWETMATWLVAISTLVAPMRGANCRWASGGIAWSPSAMRNQVGSVIHYQDGNNLADAPTRFVVVMFGVPGQPMLVPVSAAELEERRPRRARRP